MVVARDTGWRALLMRVATLKQATVKVGVFGGAEDGVDIAFIAACQEFGTATIPERSFIRATLIQREGEIRSLISKLAKGVIDGKLTSARALELLGTWAAAQIKAAITQTDIPPPLAPATIAAKGSSKPLIDTGQLVNSITHKLSTDTGGTDV